MDLMRARLLPERWPVAAAMGIATFVLLVGLWTVSPGLTIAFGVAFVFAAACLSFVNRSEGDHGGLNAGKLERFRRSELALATATDVDTAARELCKQVVTRLDAPAAVVIVEGVGETVRIEAGDTQTHSIHGEGSYSRALQAEGLPMGSIAVAPRPNRPYDDRDERALDDVVERASSTLHRLALFEGLRQQQAAIGEAVTSASDGIFSAGSDLKVRSWNPAMERLTGVTADEAIGQPCCAAFRPVDEEGEPLYGSMCPGRSGKRAQLVMRLDSGTPGNRRVLWLSATFSPLPDKGYVAIVRDITEQKQIDDERTEQIATVAHELRTPLSPIRGFLEELTNRERKLTVAQRRHMYEVMLREEQRLERSVQQLLHATSLEQSSAPVMLEKLDWDAVVREQIEILQREHAEREFSVDIDSELPPVIADDQLAAQVMANLLSNAVRFSPDGSAIEIGAVKARERVVTTVADHGPGIPYADRDRVFEKFSRLGAQPSEAQGVGLGLYIVRRSIEAMGGTVWVDETEGGGASFSFSLPTEPLAPERLVRTR